MAGIEENALSALAKMPTDLALVKMENDSFMAAAALRPRDYGKITVELQKLVQAYPAAAAEAVYSKPVGKVTEITCNCGYKYQVTKIDNNTVCPKCDGKHRKSARVVDKFADGLSIRAAESIRTVMGFTRLAVDVTVDANGAAMISGTFSDYAAGNITTDKRLVPKTYRARGGGMVEIADDRYWDVTVKAGKAKLRRDLILDSIPGMVKAVFRDECEKVMRRLVTPEKIKQEIIPAFANYGIELEHLEAIVGKTAAVGWTEEDRLQLVKLYSSLKNDELTAGDIFRTIAENEAETKSHHEADNTPTRHPKDSKPDPNAKEPERPTDTASALRRPREASGEPQAKPKAEPKAETKAPPVETKAAPSETKPAASETTAEKPAEPAKRGRGRPPKAPATTPAAEPAAPKAPAADEPPRDVAEASDADDEPFEPAIDTEESQETPTPAGDWGFLPNGCPDFETANIHANFKKWLRGVLAMKNKPDVNKFQAEVDDDEELNEYEKTLSRAVTDYQLGKLS